MKAYVIAISDLPESMEIAKRCIESAKRFDVDVEHFDAITPRKDPMGKLKTYGLPGTKFEERWSYKEKCVSAFLSHYSLWLKCIESNETTLILEHDAVFLDRIPMNAHFRGLLSLGAPSYGKYNVPTTLGINSLTSKRYLPGAHAYVINPWGAKQLVEVAKQHAGPTDVFLNLDLFPWLQEFYPWPITALDSFTTIQKVDGCLAKHNYTEGYKIL